MKASLVQWLPHVNAAFNISIVFLLVAAFVAIRRGERTLHPRLMKAAVSLGVLFLLSYLLQVGLSGHRRFPGDDWVRTLFLVILSTHTLLAMMVPFLVLRALFLAYKGRFSAHRKIVRWAFPIWLYVAFTGVFIYWMNNHLRPHV